MTRYSEIQDFLGAVGFWSSVLQKPLKAEIVPSAGETLRDRNQHSLFVINEAVRCMYVRILSLNHRRNGSNKNYEGEEGGRVGNEKETM